MAFVFGIMGIKHTNKAIRSIESIMKSEIFIDFEGEEVQ